MRILHVADGESAGGGAPGGEPAIETPVTGEAALESAISKLYPGDAEAKPDLKKPETTKQPEAKAEGETIDLSHTEDSPKPEEVEAAKAEGLTVDEYRAARQAEQERTDAITAKTGETLEEIYAREDAEGKQTDLETAKPKGAARTFTQDEVERTIQKRLRHLAEENTDLKRQLAEKPAAAGAAGNPLANVTDPAQLAEARVNAEEGLQFTQRMIQQLGYAPARVEKQLRALAAKNEAVAAKFIKTVNDEDREDFSVERMAEVLDESEGLLRAQLRAVPEREAFLKERANVSKLMQEPELKKALPWMYDEESDERAQFTQLTKLPQLAGHPRGEYLAAALMLGFKQLAPVIKQIADRQAGKKPGANGAVKLRLKSRLPGTGSVGGRVSDTSGLAAKIRKMESSKSPEDAADVVAEVFRRGK
jgi:hypothetical protein